MNTSANSLSRIPENIVPTLILKSNDYTRIAYETYLLKDNILCYKTAKNFNRIVVPKSLQTTVLEACHDNSGHMDFTKTYSKLSHRYFWHSAYKDCKEYVRSCHICQQFNYHTTKRIGLLNPRKISTKPSYAISLDHCRFPEDKNKKKHILIIIAIALYM